MLLLKTNTINYNKNQYISMRNGSPSQFPIYGSDYGSQLLHLRNKAPTLSRFSGFLFPVQDAKVCFWIFETCNSLLSRVSQFALNLHTLH